jgi:8-oxo-dGTP diphosphatase
MKARKRVKVTCAIIFFDHLILAVQRSALMSNALKWEFPGGKIEIGESEIDCIEREIEEELKIEIAVKKRLTPNVHSYPNITIELIPFLAEYISGEVLLKEHIQYRLLTKEQLNELDWAEADLPILLEFLNL